MKDHMLQTTPLCTTRTRRSKLGWYARDVIAIWHGRAITVGLAAWTVEARVPVQRFRKILLLGDTFGKYRDRIFGYKIIAYQVNCRDGIQNTNREIQKLPSL